MKNTKSIKGWKRVNHFIFNQKCIPWFVFQKIKEIKESKASFRYKFDENIDYILTFKAKVYSFDIFDTIITRSTIVPEGIFLIIQKEFKNCKIAFNLPRELKDNFLFFRIESEKKARKATCKKEINIYDIYNELSKNFNLSVSTKNFLINFEIEQELKHIKVVPQIANLINFLHANNRRVIYVSDMYLPENVIRKMLERIGVFKDIDRIYLSNEFNATKADGSLFLQVMEEEQCLPSEIIHIGDNIQSDVIRSRKKGINSFYFTDTHPNRYENIILNDIKSTGDNILYYNSIWEEIAKASKLARLNAGKYTKEYQRIFYSIGANIAGPILVSYVLWIIKKTQELKIKRLYFIARDGQILLEIAKRINKFLGLDIDLRYLYGSRQTFNLNSNTSINVVSKYLEQEGLNDKIRWAIVDLGWQGSLQDSLAKIIALAGFRNREIYGFYFGLIKNNNDDPNNIKMAYFFNLGSKDSYFQIGSDFITILEVLTSANHGTTLSYYQNIEGRWLPKLRSNFADSYSMMGIECLRNGIYAFLDNLPHEIFNHWDFISETTKFKLATIMKFLQYSPTIKEAVTLGDFYYTSSPGDVNLKPFAPKFTLSKALIYGISYYCNNRKGYTYWLEGSRKRSGGVLNIFLSWRCQRLLRKLGLVLCRVINE